MGLEQNADGTWVFTNPAQTFIDPATFSSPDPDFPTAPVDDDDEEADTTCEVGFLYDSTLKKCVPEVPTYEKQVAAYTGEEDKPFYTPGKKITTTLSADDPWAAMGGGKGYLTYSMEGVNELFPYDTYNKTRAQYNEHMLILEGLQNGYIMYDYDSGSYIKMPFAGKDEEARKVMGAGAWKIMEYYNEKSYNDYFEILEKGWQPASDQNSWKTLIQGKAQYSLTGGMLSFNDETGETMIQFSKEFQEKINKALKLKEQGTDAMIDRDGNININADGKGGYYNDDGKFTAADGSVAKGGSLAAGIRYLFELQNSGLKMPTSLRNRLIKGLKTLAVSTDEKNKLAIDAGFKSIDDAINTLNNVDSWSMADVVTEVKEVVPIVSEQDFEADDAGGIGDWTAPEPSGPDEVFDDKPDWADAPGTGVTEPEETDGGEGFQPGGPPGQPSTGLHYGYGEGSSTSTPKKDKYERPGTEGAPGHHW